MAADRARTTRTERKLHHGAEHHWPGSGDRLVTAYRAYARTDLSLWAAATISSALQCLDERADALALLRERCPTSTRRGPKRDRHEAAVTALDSLMLEVSR